MSGISSILTCVAIIATGPAPIQDHGAPVVHWQIVVMHNRDDSALKAGDARVSAAEAPPDVDFTPASNSARKPAEKRLEKGKSKNDKVKKPHQTPPHLNPFSTTMKMEAADVTLVDDDSIVDVNGLNVRLRASGPVAVTENGERQIKSILGMNGGRHFGLLTFDDDGKTSISVSAPILMNVIPNDGKGKRSWKSVLWESTAVSVHCDQYGPDRVSAAELRLCRSLSWGIDPDFRPDRQHAAECFSTASFWIGPHQTAMIRMPRFEGDGGSTVAFIKAFRADAECTKRMKDARAKRHPAETVSQPTTISTLLPLPEVP